VRSSFYWSTAFAGGLLGATKMEHMIDWTTEIDWMTGEVIDLQESLVCRMCGTKSLDCLQYADIHDQAQVCGRCAGIVANSFAKVHSGNYLTWDEEESNFSVGHYRPRKKISASIRKQIMERDKYRCVKCASHIDLQLDHIYPHIRGGSDNPDNLQTLCAPCNRLKKDKVEV
jgi:HNH endonuclease